MRYSLLVMVWVGMVIITALPIVVPNGPATQIARALDTPEPESTPMIPSTHLPTHRDNSGVTDTDEKKVKAPMPELPSTIPSTWLPTHHDKREVTNGDKKRVLEERGSHQFLNTEGTPIHPHRPYTENYRGAMKMNRVLYPDPKKHTWAKRDDQIEGVASVNTSGDEVGHSYLRKLIGRATNVAAMLGSPLRPHNRPMLIGRNAESETPATLLALPPKDAAIQHRDEPALGAAKATGQAKPTNSIPCTYCVPFEWRNRHADGLPKKIQPPSGAESETPTTLLTLPPKDAAIQHRDEPALGAAKATGQAKPTNSVPCTYCAPFEWRNRHADGLPKKMQPPGGVKVETSTPLVAN